MDVVLGICRYVEVHDITHVRDIDAAGQHVGCHKDIDLAVAELLKGALALVLVAVAVDGGTRDACLAQAAATGVRAVLGTREDDGATWSFAAKNRGEKGVLGLKRDGQHKLLDGLGHGTLVCDLDRCRVFYQVFDAADRALVKGSGEQQRLALGRRLGHDLSHLRQKAHVKHAVGLVKHQHVDLAQHGLTLLDKVNKSAGGRDQHIAAAAKRLLLRLVPHASHNGKAVMPSFLLNDAANVGDLLCQLSRGRDH